MRYGSPVSTLIIAHKDRQAWQLCGVLGALLLAVLQALPPVDCLVPVPSTPQAERERGYDHTKALALWCGRRMRVPVRGLLSSGVGSDHAKLNANERMREVSGRFRAPPGHSQVILIDDVITTGATAAECVHTLRTAGYGVMGAGMIADAAL
jgi:predicted amidophosphoribosyltransferase